MGETMTDWSNMKATPLTIEAFEEGMRRMLNEPVMARERPRIISPQAWERLQRHRADRRFGKLHDSILVECAVANVDPALVLPNRRRKR